MTKKYRISLTIVPAVVIADQATKLFVDRYMHLHQSVTVIENFFNFTYIRNRGAAFGILSGMDDSLRLPIFIILSIAAVAAVIYALGMYRENSALYPSALSLILGGAAGNLIDRIRLGEVIDFIDIHWYEHHWPAFNVADSAITFGAGLLILQMLTEGRRD